MLLEYAPMGSTLSADYCIMTEAVPASLYETKEKFTVDNAVSQLRFLHLAPLACNNVTISVYDSHHNNQSALQDINYKSMCQIYHFRCIPDLPIRFFPH